MTAVNVSVKDQLSLSISIAVGGALVSLCEQSLTHPHSPV
jgi:Ca2+/H+ antiporter